MLKQRAWGTHAWYMCASLTLRSSLPLCRSRQSSQKCFYTFGIQTDPFGNYSNYARYTVHYTGLNKTYLETVLEYQDIQQLGIVSQGC